MTDRMLRRYSMNGVDGSELMTIHVTPEAGFSYASCEMHLAAGLGRPEAATVHDVVSIFQPWRFVVACTYVHAAQAAAPVGAAHRGPDAQWAADSAASTGQEHLSKAALQVPGYTCLGTSSAELIGGQCVVHHCFERQAGA